MTLDELKSCAKIADEMSSIKSQIAALEAKLFFAKHPKLDGMPKTPSGGDGSDMLVKYIDLKDRYEKLYIALVMNIESLEKELPALTRNQRLAVRYRYIQGLSISDVAKKMSYTERQVHRLLREAEAKLCQ